MLRSGPGGSSAIVELEHVGLRYGRGPEILRELDLSLRPGSFHFLKGDSGAGKTSLLKLIYLAMRPSRGLVRLFGEDVTGLRSSQRFEYRRNIGVIFQDFRLIDEVSVLENVCLPLRVAKQDRAKAVRDAADIIEWVGLRGRMHALPPTLSGGEKQRVAIARAVIHRPALILADEPTGNIDEAHGARIMKLFRELNSDGATVLIATHDPELQRHAPAPVLHLVDGSVMPDHAVNSDHRR